MASRTVLLVKAAHSGILLQIAILGTSGLPCPYLMPGASLSARDTSYTNFFHLSLYIAT
jgi:hypothetical protein